MSAFSHCQQCGRRLRDAVFCPECSHSMCCCTCLDAHRAQHAVLTATKAVPNPSPRPVAPAGRENGRGEKESWGWRPRLGS